MYTCISLPVALAASSSLLLLWANFKACSHPETEPVSPDCLVQHPTYLSSGEWSDQAQTRRVAESGLAELLHTAEVGHSELKYITSTI